ncbi:copper amine oxidase N-terminal domain-containing protein [Paenibacillus sacheonensis]|uniref:Copper amine oxidase-like N-terminal domain-containing protein n=1 Tax=Paenibacillus sacheonensis TaxID=742054 RepID=A0A7X5C1C5_9BACL|nr:copper amine oxidase N-terminal domain-containing protein [Paenibacillus sacheonensis]MBM7564749.1 hypothetical protein [Paenibacillus sacheonensis]NBC69304.1 hypothetical protein [Paenibacillus sacheonensis]
MKSNVMHRVFAVLASLAGAMMLTFLAAPAASAASSVYLTVNGVPTNQPSLVPLLIEGHAYVPVRAMAELAGEAVEWDGGSCSVLIRTKPAAAEGMSCRGVQLWIDGKRTSEELKPIIRNNRAYVPIRTATAAFGMPVAWDNVKRSVNVTKKAVDSLAAYHLLPDGRYRIEKLAARQIERIQEPVTTSQLRSIGADALARSEKFEATVMTGHGDVLVKLQKVSLAGRSIVMPQDIDQFPLEYVITPDGNKSFVVADNGIWLINSAAKKLQRISPLAYKGKTFSMIAKEGPTNDEHWMLYWNGGVRPSPDGTKLIYTSNKTNRSPMEAALFTYDLATGAETRIGKTDGAMYEIIGWLDSQRVLCIKEYDSVRTTIAVNMQGEERELDLPDIEAQLFAVQDDRIAYYVPHNDGDEFHIASIDSSSELHDIATLRSQGSIRMRGGQAFSLHGSYLAFIYVPNDEPMARYLKVIQLNTETVTDIDTFPLGAQASAAILEFAWADDDTIVAVIHEDEA